MSNSHDQSVNHAPAVSLNSADYLTDRKIIKEYEQIQVEHLHRVSWIERVSQRPAVRRIARDGLRVFMFLMALLIAGAVLFYLEYDASMAYMGR